MPLQCNENIDLFPFNTLGVHAYARYLFVIETVGDLQAWHQQFPSSPFIVLGGGSNIVIAGNIHQHVLLNRIKGLEIVIDSHGEALVSAGAGENWHEFVLWTLAQGWNGLENLALIPGTVGASPIQNIGAYGVEIADRFHSLDAFDVHTGASVVLAAQDCCFGYRHSLFKQPGGERYIITRVTFRLSRKPALVLDYGDVRRMLTERNVVYPTPHDVCEVIQAIRREKLPDPKQEPNAGSFFKNPVISVDQFDRFIACHPEAVHYPLQDGTFKLAAGWLIDRLGWRGRMIGPVSVNARQALVLINRSGSGEDILHAAQIIAQSVQDYYGITLEIEPRIVGQQTLP